MTYNGRRGPHVSQYLLDLNTSGPQAASPGESFNIEDDLALFTNTEFFDFDSGQNTDFQAQGQPSGKSDGPSPGNVSSAAPSVMGDLPNLDFLPPDFNFSDFSNTFAAPSFDEAPNFQPPQSAGAPGPVYGNQLPPQQQAHFAHQAPTGAGSITSTDTSPSAGRSGSAEDSSRLAADEDKRRRNTAASARFRIKKKQREQALEKSAKEMSEKVLALENKVSQLETENKWLKNLLVEKSEGTDDISSMWKEFTRHAAERTKAAALAKQSAMKEER